VPSTLAVVRLTPITVGLRASSAAPRKSRPAASLMLPSSAPARSCAIVGEANAKYRMTTMPAARASLRTWHRSGPSVGPCNAGRSQAGAEVVQKAWNLCTTCRHIRDFPPVAASSASSTFTDEAPAARSILSPQSHGSLMLAAGSTGRKLGGVADRGSVSSSERRGQVASHSLSKFRSATGPRRKATKCEVRRGCAPQIARAHSAEEGPAPELRFAQPGTWKEGLCTVRFAGTASARET